MVLLQLIPSPNFGLWPTDGEYSGILPAFWRGDSAFSAVFHVEPSIFQFDVIILILSTKKIRKWVIEVESRSDVH